MPTEGKKLTMYIRDGHFVVNDGCEQKIETCPLDLPSNSWIVDYYAAASVSKARRHFREANLLFFNKTATDAFFSGGKSMPVVCPVCGGRYEITSAEYFALKG